MAALGGLTSAQPPVELYRRVIPLEATIGVISISQTVAREFEVPEKCEDDDTMGCTATRHFGRIWRINFEVETRRGGDAAVLVESEGRGTVFLALAADRADEDNYDEYLRDGLAKLGAAAFDEPFAGLSPSREPFGGPVAARSVEPSWSCFENAGDRKATRYSRQLTVGDDGREQVSGTSSNGYGRQEITRPLCSALENATADGYPDVIRTMSTPRVLVEEVLRVEVSDTLPPRAYVDELLALPEGAWLARKSVPGVKHSKGVSRQNEIVESRIAVDEVEISARIMPAELPVGAVRDNSWHSRWTFETVERRLGPLPETRLTEAWSITASLMPTLPPRETDQENSPQIEQPEHDAAYPVHLNQEELFASVAEFLNFRTQMSPGVLADAIVRKIDGLDAPGWILVLCRPDDEATWGLAPTQGRSRLLNGDAFCGIVSSLLPSR